MKYKRLTINIAFTLFVFLCVIIAYKLSLIDLSPLTNKNSESVHFNLITVNSIFAGFLFTSLTFFTGVTNTKTIEILERIDYMDKVYLNINWGFISSIISIILSGIGIFILPAIRKFQIIINLDNIIGIISVIFPSLIITFLICTIIKFLSALRDLKFIINSIRRKSLGKVPSRESVDRTLREIKKSKK